MRDPEPQNPAEHAARDRQMAHAFAVVADLIGFAQAATVGTNDLAATFVGVALRAADVSIECKPEHQEGFMIGLLAAAVISAANRRAA